MPTIQKFKLLDLFCGAGGCTKGYMTHFDVTGVDHRYFHNYHKVNPNKFIRADAFAFLANPDSDIAQYDVIHASPPCQAYSQATHRRDTWPDLIEPVRNHILKYAPDTPYVIENVVGAPLIRRSSIELCGSMFGLDLERHRLFESNIPLQAPFCMHEWQAPRYLMRRHGKNYYSRVIHVYGAGGGKGGHDWNRAMEIDWMIKEELVDAIPPAYTKFVGAQIRSYLEYREIQLSKLRDSLRGIDFGNGSDTPLPSWP